LWLIHARFRPRTSGSSCRCAQAQARGESAPVGSIGMIGAIGPVKFREWGMGNGDQGVNALRQATRCVPGAGDGT
jgi:hypothetical protein